MWEPTNTFLRGKIIKPFLPFDKYPNLSNENLKNLYPGDEIYIFETKNARWARGYSLTKPFPKDFTVTSVNLDDLPGINVKVVIFPLKYFKLVEKIEFVKIDSKVIEEKALPTIRDVEVDYKQALDGDIQFQRPIPHLPEYKLSKTDDLLLEIKNALELLNFHLFGLYSIGEFKLFNNLLKIYYTLHEARVKIDNDLLNSNEIQDTKEIAVFSLNKIPKKLASRASRLNSINYDLDNDFTDILGYKAILARDSFTGELLSNDNCTPSRLALNQVLCALEPNFPINCHNNKEKYSLKPSSNKKLQYDNPSHIMVDFISVSGTSAYQPPGFAGMIAYLYIRNTKKRLTEAFAIHTDSVDDLANVEMISAALFKNTPFSEIENSRIYLVAVLTEEVILNSKSSNLPTIRKVKKGVAAGVADITRIFSRNQGSLESGEADQFKIKLFGSYMNSKKGKRKSMDFSAAMNNGWGELVDRIITGSTHGVAVNPRAETLIVSVKEFKHQFTGQNFDPVASAPISRIKPIFFDPLAENYERIYLQLGRISILKPSSTNDLLTIEVSTPNNDLITFAKASNQQERKRWQFISVCTDEAIGEIVKVNGVSLQNPSKNVPKDDYIILSLYVNGILAGEGKLLYKSGDRLVEYSKSKKHSVDIISTAHNIPMALLELNTEYIGKIYNSDFSVEDIFQFDSFFRAGQKGINDLAESLLALSKLDILHLVKYFPELLSSFYSIIDASIHQPQTPSIETLQNNVFTAFIHLLDTIFGKQDQYLYMMDAFIERYKNLPPVGTFFLLKMSNMFNKADSNWNSSCRALCRVVALIMKLALNSIEESHESDIEEFNKVLSSVLESGAFFLSIQNSILINDQIAVLEVIDYFLIFKLKADEKLLLEHIFKFIDSIGVRGLGANEEDSNLKKNSIVGQKDHKIIVCKLLLIHRLFNTSLVETHNTRTILISKAVTWSMQVLLGPTDIDATRLACSIMNTVCSLLWKTVFVDGKSDEVDSCYSISKLLPAIARTFGKYYKYTKANNYFTPRRTFTYLFPTVHPFKEVSIDATVNDVVLVEILCELASVYCFIANIGVAVAGNEGFSKILSTKIANDFFLPDIYLAQNFQNEDISTLIPGAKLMIRGKFFPQDKWLSFYAMIANGCLNSLELVKPLLIHFYVPPIEKSELFDKVLWGNFLKVLLRIATLPPVSVEHLADIPKKACYQITHTTRDRVANILSEAWDQLSLDASKENIIRFNLKKFGGYQVEFISREFGILQDLILFSLQRNDKCQTVGVKVLWSILISEYALSDNIIDVERECLLGLHEIYSGNGYKPSLVDQETFIEKLKATIRLDREDEAFSLIYKFVDNLQEFMAVLNDLNSVPVGPEFDDDRTFHKLTITSYLKNANKPELFHSFINAMYEEYLNKNDFIQAALSLELLASTYDWDHHNYEPPSFRPIFPEQSSFERKEALFKMIANNYIKGNSLERAMDTYNELLDAYNAHTYDLKSFAYVHQKLAKLYLDLESSDKLSPSFFRVEFIGAGFPTNIRGKAQIYEGLPFEHITSIHERLLKLYPGARIVTDDVEAQKLGDRVQTGRYLYVSTVEPTNEISDKLFNTSIGVRQYARNKDLRFFTTKKKLPGATSVFDLWTEETTYETCLSFPTLMNRSDILKSTVVKLSPLDNAIRAIISKNNDLIQLESIINLSIKEKKDYKSFLNDLSRQLAGTVDSPVNGGVGQYRKFYTDTKYNNPQFSDEIRLLKNGFKDLTIILSRCLHLHAKLIPSSMKPAHDALVDLFQKNFKPDIENLKLNTDYENSTYHNPSIITPPSSSTINDRRSSSGLSGMQLIGNFGAPSIPGSKLTRSTSIHSSTSSHSGFSGISSGISSSMISEGNPPSEATLGSGYASKRTAINWRSKDRD